MTPKCCQTCDNLTAYGNCSGKGKHCPTWLAWFSREWAGIRQVTERVKEQRRTKT